MAVLRIGHDNAAQDLPAVVWNRPECRPTQRVTPVAHRISILPGNKSFDAEPGESILAAARRAGLALPYSCLGGVCGSCKASLIAGHCDYPKLAPLALSADERAHGDVLLCQAVAESDLTISAREVPSVAELPRRQLPARIVAKILLAADVMQLRLATPKADPLRWLAGQYLDILLPEGRRRAFSIANAPHQGPEIKLHIRQVPGGGFTHAVFDGLPVGSLLRIEGPLGTFVPREASARPMILMAGGTGFAPIKAIIEHFLHLGSTRPMHFYWGARQPSDLYLPDLPAHWARRHPAFQFTAVLSAADGDGAGRYRSGLVHQAVLDDFPDLSPFDVYMSGPPPMIEAARHSFLGAGLHADRLYYDSFEYAPEIIAAILAGRAGLRGL
ncbi:MAG: NAD(P)H-flavin reductase [Lysobacterales bacterium CG02_land_8_20_14_3_00_62_12]|nr:MAG: NAD(P)H-flavin reductase [Xanthomonadales bacterium CG02_land_8_20_14_3_00_62_12]